MEYLTELKEGTEIPVACLDKYIRTTNSYAYNSTESFSTGVSGISSEPKIRVVTTLYPDRFVVTKTASACDIYYKLAGFTKFYNKFYNLTPKTMSRIEDWHNCVFYTDTPAQYKEIGALLRAIGFQGANASNAAYIRTESLGCALQYSSNRKDWHSNLHNPREFEPEEAIAALSGISAQPLSKVDAKCRSIYLGNIEESVKVQERLIELGYAWCTSGAKIMESSDYIGIWIYVDSYGKIVRVDKRGEYPVMTHEQLFPQSRININNYINTKTDGKIIVSRKATTITVGQRPTGSAVSGRTSRVAITVGHLSNQAINSGF